MNQIESNRIESNQNKSNRIESNRIKSNQSKSNQIKSNQSKSKARGARSLTNIMKTREGLGKASGLRGSRSLTLLAKNFPGTRSATKFIQNMIRGTQNAQAYQSAPLQKEVSTPKAKPNWGKTCSVGDVESIQKLVFEQFLLV